MTEIATALQTLFGSFGIPAYVEGYVPDNAELPYITYSLIQPDWSNPVSLPIRIWYRSKSYAGICAKIDEVAQFIGEGWSKKIGNGAIVLFKDNNFAQFQPYDNGDVKVAYLNFIFHAILN